MLAAIAFAAAVATGGGPVGPTNAPPKPPHHRVRVVRVPHLGLDLAAPIPSTSSLLLAVPPCGTPEAKDSVTCIRWTVQPGIPGVIVMRPTKGPR